MSSTDTTSIYPTFDKKLTEKTLHRIFTPDAADLAFAGLQSSGQFKASKAFLLVVLKCTQYLCAIPQPHQIPLYVTRFVVRTAYPRHLVRYEEFTQYAKSGTFKRHLKLVREYLGFQSSASEVRDKATDFAESAARTKTHHLDVLNSVIEALIRAGHELPALSTLEKISRQASSTALKDIFTRIINEVTPVLRVKIDELLTSGGSSQKSQWQQLKEAVNLPKQSVFKAYLASFDTLQDLVTLLPPLVDIIPERKRQCVSEALALHSRDMRRLPPTKRYVLAILLIDHRWTEGLDQLTTLLIKTMQEIESAAMRKHTASVVKQGKETSVLVGTLQDILCHWGSSDAHDQRHEYLESIYQSKGEELIRACQQHLAHHNKGHRSTMITLFAQKRGVHQEPTKCTLA